MKRNNIRWTLKKLSADKRKLTDEQVQLAIARVTLGESRSAVARDMGVSHSAICDLVSGRKYRGMVR